MNIHTISAKMQLRSFVLLVSALSCMFLAASAEYHIERFLKDREDHLRTFIKLPEDDKLDEEIEKFALAPGTSTVRLAPWVDCKQQFYLHHHRVVANDNPLHFGNFCPASAEDRKAYMDRLMKRRKGDNKGPAAEPGADEVEGKETRAEVPEGHPVPNLDPKKPESPQDIRIAFTIFVNPNDPIWRIHRVINAVYTEKDFFFVHIDASPQYRTQAERDADKAPRDEQVKAINHVMAPFVKNGNLRVEAVFDVSWGGVSMLNAELAMAQGLLEMGDWDYWINLSSTDYPLKPVDHLRKHLFAQYGKNFMSGFKTNMENEPKAPGESGLARTYVECHGHSYRVDDLMKLPTGIDIWGASSWYVLQRSFVEWLNGCMALGFARRKEGQCATVLDFLDYSQYRVNFEEQFLQTVQKNTEWCRNYANDDLRFVDWTKDWDGCEHWEEVDGCGSSPQTIGFDKWMRGREVPSKFFARKFEDPKVFDQIDAELGINTTKSMSAYVAQKEHQARNKKSEEPDLPNVALGKYAFASSEQRNNNKVYHAHHAVDNSTKTRWSSDHYEPQHIAVRLSTEAAPFCDVSEVHMVWETAYASEYTLKVSKDMKKWKRVYVGDEKNRPRPRNKKELTHKIPLGDMGKGIQGIKFDCKKRGTSWGFSVWEIKAFGECFSEAGGGDARIAQADAPAF